MSQSLNLHIKGRFTSFNELSEVPPGALLEADNIDIIQDSIAQPRRGFDRVLGSYSNANDRTDALFEYVGATQNTIISHHGTYGSANTLSYLDSNTNTWTDLETVSAITGRRMRFIGANQNLYYTSSTGLRAIESYNGTPRMVGAYKALDVTASISSSLSTWLTTGNSVAYRAVWLYPDSHGNLVFGAPSQVEVITNGSGSTKAIDVVVTIPAGVTTSWFVQLYRSAQISGTPNDELGLVYEASPTSMEISSLTMTVTDIVPDSLRGAIIYTAASQNGLAYQNELPPLSEDMDIFRESVFFANTTSKQRYNLTMISVGSTAGVQSGDTLTIDGVVYTADSSETASTGHFKVTTGGSAASNIDVTTKSLVRVINQYASSTVYAYYLSGPTDLPGQMLLEARVMGASAFAINSSRATCWNPTNLPTSGSTIVSSADTFLNGLAWSNPSQPEAAPLPNFVQVGSKNDKILRIKALRDALYIFKESGKVYKLSGYFPTFQVDKIEDSVKLIARESLQVLNNQLYALTDQGVIVLSDSTKVISRPIEQELLSLISQNYDLVQSVVFGVSYESDRKYYLFVPGGGADSYPTEAHVFNVFTNAWTKHTISGSCAMVSVKNTFYLGAPDVNIIKKEKRNYSFLDYADYGFDTSISSISGTTIGLDSGTDNISTGDILYSTSSLFATILSVNTVTSSCTIQTDPGFSAGSISILKAIPTRIVWVSATLGNPGIQKQIHTVTPIFKSDFVGTATIGFYTDLDVTEEFVTVQGKGLGLWGLFPWGTEPWGGSTLKRPVRQWLPLAKQRSSQLTVSWNHTYGFSAWELVGITLVGELGSENVNNG